MITFGLVAGITYHFAMYLTSKWRSASEDAGNESPIDVAINTILCII